MPVRYILVNSQCFHSRVECEAYGSVPFQFHQMLRDFEGYQHLIPYAKRFMLQTRKGPILEQCKGIRWPG